MAVKKVALTEGEQNLFGMTEALLMQQADGLQYTWEQHQDDELGPRIKAVQNTVDVAVQELKKMRGSE